MIYGDEKENGSDMLVQSMTRQQQTQRQVDAIFLMQGLSSDEKIMMASRARMGQLTDEDMFLLGYVATGTRTPDILSIMQSSNLYVYGMNNPLKYTDPSGENALTAWWGGAMWWLTLVDGPLPIGDAVYVAGIGACVIVGGIMYAKTSKESAKSRATDAPSWLAGGMSAKPPNKNEKAQDYAKRLLDEKYGKGNWKKGADSEYSKIVKYLQRNMGMK